MRRELDLHLVRAFLAVADHGSMTAAARQLHRTQGAVSQQVQRLEEALGTPLLYRAHRRVTPTDAGERFAAQARQLLALNDGIWADMADRALQGSVRLGVPYDLAGTAFAPVFEAFARDWPLVELSIVCRSSPELLGLLQGGALDLAVVEEPAGQETGECLRVEPLVWVGAPGGSAHLRRPLPVSMVAPTCAFRPAVLQALQAHGLAWRTVFEGGSLDATAATVGAGLAVTAWLACTVPAGLATLAPGACGLPALPPFAISLHLPPDGGSATARALVGCIRDGLGGGAEGGAQRAVPRSPKNVANAAARNGRLHR